MTAPPRNDRPRAFDAALAHSWHYYNPRSNASSPALAHGNIPTTTRPDHARHTTAPPPQSPPQPVFDAANPRTWNRSASSSRLLLEENRRDRPIVRSVLDRAVARTPGLHVQAARQRHVGDTSTRTLNEWSEYLNQSSGDSAQERAAILADVYRALQRTTGSSSAMASAQQRRAAPFRPPPPAGSMGLASMLHDPDFGDTSAYWNAVVAENTRNNAQYAYVRRSGNTSASASASMVLTQQQQAQQQQQRRRRGSMASVNTTNSQATLPEYDCGDWALPDYRSQISSRGSMEINV